MNGTDEDEDEEQSNELDEVFHGFHRAKQSIALTHAFFDQRHEYLLDSINSPKIVKHHKKRKKKNKNKDKDKDKYKHQKEKVVDDEASNANMYYTKLEIREKGWKRHQRIATLNKIDIQPPISPNVSSASSSKKNKKNKKSHKNRKKHKKHSDSDEFAVFDIADFAKQTYKHYNNNIKKKKFEKLEKKKRKKERKRKLKEKQKEIERIERKMYSTKDKNITNNTNASNTNVNKKGFKFKYKPKYRSNTSNINLSNKILNNSETSPAMAMSSAVFNYQQEQKIEIVDTDDFHIEIESNKIKIPPKPKQKAKPKAKSKPIATISRHHNNNNNNNASPTPTPTATASIPNMPSTLSAPPSLPPYTHHNDLRDSSPSRSSSSSSSSSSTSSDEIELNIDDLVISEMAPSRASPSPEPLQPHAYETPFNHNDNDNGNDEVNRRIPSMALSLMDTNEYHDPSFWGNHGNNNDNIHKNSNGSNSSNSSSSMSMSMRSILTEDVMDEKTETKVKLQKFAKKQIFIQDIHGIFNPKYNSRWIKFLRSDNENGDVVDNGDQSEHSDHWEGLSINKHISLVPKLIFLSKSFFESKEAIFIFNLVCEGIETLINSKEIRIKMMKQLHFAFEKAFNIDLYSAKNYSQLQVLEKQILWIGNVVDKLKNNPFLSIKAFHDCQKQNNYINEFKSQLNEELMQLYHQHSKLAKQEQFRATVKLKKLKKIQKRKEKKRLFGWFKPPQQQTPQQPPEEKEYTNTNITGNDNGNTPMGHLDNIADIDIDNYSLYFILLCLLLRHYNNGRNFLLFTISRSSIRMTELGDKILDIFGIITKCGNIYRILCYLKICMKVLSTEASYFDDILQRLSDVQEYLIISKDELITLREKLHLKKIINTVNNWCKLCVMRYQHVFFGPTGPRALKSCLRCWKFSLLMLYKLNGSNHEKFERKWCEKVKQVLKKSIFDYEFPRLVELYKIKSNVAKNKNKNKKNGLNGDSPIDDATQLIMVIKACRKYLRLDEQEYEGTFKSYCNEKNFSLLKITSSQYMTLTFSFSNLYLRVLAFGIKEKIEDRRIKIEQNIDDELDFEIDASVWALYQELKRFYDDLKRIYKLLRKKKINCTLPSVHYADHYNDIIAYWSQYQGIKFTNPYNGYVKKLCNAENWKKISENVLYSNSIIDLFTLIDPLQYWFLNLPYTNENLLDFAKLLTDIIISYVTALHEKITKYLLKELEKKELAFYTKNKKKRADGNAFIVWNFPQKLMIAVNDIIMAKTQLQETINKLMLDRRYNTEDSNNDNNNNNDVIKKNKRIVKHASFARYHTLKQTMLLTPESLFGHGKQESNITNITNITAGTVTTFYKHKIAPSEFNYNYFDEENDIEIWNSLNCIQAFQTINKSLSAVSFLIAQGLNSDISHEIFLLLWENTKFPPTLSLTKEKVEDELMDMLWKKLCTKCDLLHENISPLFTPYILTDFFSLICLDFIKLLIPKRLKYVLNLNQLTRIEYAIDEIQNFLLDCYNISPVLIDENENLYKLRHILTIQLSGATYLIKHHKELYKDEDFNDKYQLQNEPFLGPKSLWLIIKHRAKHHKHDQLLIRYFETHSGIKAQFKSFTNAVRNRWG